MWAPRRASAFAAERLTCSYTDLVQQVLDVPNEVAAELAGIGDSVLSALRDRLGDRVAHG